jgi:hypothetical protein
LLGQPFILRRKRAQPGVAAPRPRPDDIGSFFIVPESANQIDPEEALQRRHHAIRQSLEQSQMVCSLTD